MELFDILFLLCEGLKSSILSPRILGEPGKYEEKRNIPRQGCPLNQIVRYVCYNASEPQRIEQQYTGVVMAPLNIASERAAHRPRRRGVSR